MRYLRGNMYHVPGADFLVFAAVDGSAANLIGRSVLGTDHRATDFKRSLTTLHDENIRLLLVQLRFARAFAVDAARLR